MINPRYISIAVAKTSDPKAREHLKRIEALARELAALEQDFPNKIAANKARRGEGPVKLSKNQKATLADVNDDLEHIDKESLELFKNVSNAREILESLTFELPGSPMDWSFMLPKAHPDDRAHIEEVIQVQRTIVEEMKKYLETHPST